MIVVGCRVGGGGVGAKNFIFEKVNSLGFVKGVGCSHPFRSFPAEAAALRRTASMTTRRDAGRSLEIPPYRKHNYLPRKRASAGRRSGSVGGFESSPTRRPKFRRAGTSPSG